MSNYAHIINTKIENVAVFQTAPDAAFAKATGGKWVLIPDETPAGIGDYWDGEHFRRGAIDGEIIAPLPPPIPVEPPPDPYAELATANAALSLLGVTPASETTDAPSIMAAAQQVRQSMDAAGAVLTDEQALIAPALYLPWQPDGVYATGDRVRYGDLLYKCLQGHTAQASWKPDATPALWTRIDNPADEWPEIRNPIPSTNPYMKGDKATYKGKRYVSLLDNNVWLPDAYPAGWELQP